MWCYWLASRSTWCPPALLETTLWVTSSSDKPHVVITFSSSKRPSRWVWSLTCALQALSLSLSLPTWHIATLFWEFQRQRDTLPIKIVWCASCQSFIRNNLSTKACNFYTLEIYLCLLKKKTLEERVIHLSFLLRFALNRREGFFFSYHEIHCSVPFSSPLHRNNMKGGNNSVRTLA